MCILPLPFLLPLYIGSFCFPLTVNPSLFFTPCQPSPFPPSILQMFSIQIPYVAVTEIQRACLERLSLIQDQPVRVLDSCRQGRLVDCLYHSRGRGDVGRGIPTKNIIEDLTRSVQISQEMVRSSYQIYLIRTQVKNLTCSYQISLV